MTVKELIEELQGYPEDMKVLGYRRGQYGEDVELKPVTLECDPGGWIHCDMPGFDNPTPKLDDENELINAVIVDWY